MSYVIVHEHPFGPHATRPGGLKPKNRTVYPTKQEATQVAKQLNFQQKYNSPHWFIVNLGDTRLRGAFGP